MAVGGGELRCPTDRLLEGVGAWLEFDHPTFSTLYETLLRPDAEGSSVYVSE